MTPAGDFAPAAGAVAVVAAMPEELDALLAELQERREVRRGPFVTHHGRVYGVNVMAAVCGIGKVNAAALTQQLLADGARALLLTGVAGALAPHLRTLDVVVARDALQHDVDVTALGYEPGRVPGASVTAFPADPRLSGIAERAAREATPDGTTVQLGRIASGDRFIGDPALRADLRERFQADCAEMEGAAAAQVCARWGVPWTIVRSISDAADLDAEMSFREFTEAAAIRSQAVVRGFLAALAG